MLSKDVIDLPSSPSRLPFKCEMLPCIPTMHGGRSRMNVKCTKMGRNCSLGAQHKGGEQHKGVSSHPHLFGRAVLRGVDGIAGAQSSHW